MKNKKLAKKILQMAKLDQKMRKSYVKDASFLRKVEEIDRLNLIEMEKIVRKFGWPTTTLVGKKASHLAWLLVQHADGNLKFQEYCLELMEKASRNEVSKANIAFLTDRILVNKGKPQIYGTQFYKEKTGKLIPRLIKDFEMLDEKRRKMGLGKFKLYQKKISRSKKKKA